LRSDLPHHQEYVAGIRSTSANGKTWNVLPQPGNLTYAQAGFAVGLGSFSTEWTVEENTFSLKFSTPVGSSGLLGVPTFVDQGRSGVIFKVYSGDSGEEVDISGLLQQQDKYFATVRDLPGGSYTVEATYA